MAATRAQKTPQIVFVSSVAAVEGYHGNTVPEDIVKDPSAASATGYGQSKQVAGRILACGCEVLQVPLTILRVGQVAGSIRRNVPESRSSPWNKDEWVPALIRTSFNLRQMPADLSVPVDWLPSNIVADSMVDAILARSQVATTNKPQVYNLINPTVTQWGLLAPRIRSSLAEHSLRRTSRSVDVKLVPYSDWLGSLEQVSQQLSTHKERAEQARIISEYPALKILPFFEDLDTPTRSGSPTDVRFDTSAAVQMSKTLSAVGAIRVEWMDKWIQEWEL